MRIRRLPFPALALGAAALASCVGEALPRRQIIVIIDTDAATLEQTLDDKELSAAASVDMVRVDLLHDATDATSDFRELSATSPLDWPLSFAIVPPEVGDRPVTRLRIRAFRARDATPFIEKDGRPTLTPPPTLAIDRIVEFAVPAPTVVDRRLVHLAASCFGQPPSFRDRTSCQDEAHPRAAFSTPIPTATDLAPRSLVGTWPRARATPCTGIAKPGSTCVPGGLSVIGSTLAVGTEDGLVIQPPLPLRLVHVSPFFMDLTEFTVGRARKWLGRLAKAPYGQGAAELDFSSYCTLSNDPASDSLPLNCVLEETARELCALEGGALPTEAQWNHAATGRGEGRRFPWGDANGACCNVSAGRLVRGFRGDAQDCPGEGVEPVGSHRGCNGFGDVSRDGVLDLGGSVTEILQDRPQALDDECWGSPIGLLDNPICTKQTGVTAVGTRGGEWAGGTLSTYAFQRRSSGVGITRGFRCVYPDGPP